MIKILKYFFYRIYSFSLSNGEKDAGWAYIIVLFFVYGNLSILMDGVLLLISAGSSKLSNAIVIAISGAAAYYLHVILTKGQRKDEIIKEFNSIKNKSALNILLMLYIVGTVILFVICMREIRALNGN
jgi:hypothetical protein